MLRGVCPAPSLRVLQAPSRPPSETALTTRRAGVPEGEEAISLGPLSRITNKYNMRGRATHVASLRAAAPPIVSQVLIFLARGADIFPSIEVCI